MRVQARNCEGLTKILDAFGPAALLSGVADKAFIATRTLFKEPKQRFPALVALVTFMKKAFNEKVTSNGFKLLHSPASELPCLNKCAGELPDF